MSDPNTDLTAALASLRSDPAVVAAARSALDGLDELIAMTYEDDEDEAQP